MPAQNRRLADQHPGNESTKHGVNANEMRCKRQQSHDHQNCGDHGKVAFEMIVCPADQQEHQPASNRDACNQENGSPNHAFGDATEVDRVKEVAVHDGLGSLETIIDIHETAGLVAVAPDLDLMFAG